MGIVQLAPVLVPGFQECAEQIVVRLLAMGANRVVANLQEAVTCLQRLTKCQKRQVNRNRGEAFQVGFDERAEILARRAAIEAELGAVAGWEVMCAGAYFAYVRHPFAEPSDDLAKRLVREASILALPGTMFTPPDDPLGCDCLRFAFANINTTGIRMLADRLAALGS